MTLQLRPTFSESWYRVKDLKPRLRAAAQTSRQYYRGERWHVVRDPAGNQFHRLSDVAYRFVGLLDGTRTVQEAWELVGGQLADDAPTQPEVIQILSQLYAANLIETNITPDAQVLLRRHKKQKQRKLQGRAMNLLFPRFPLWDPDTFLKRWLPLGGPMISKPGAIIWLAVVGLALLVLLPRLDDFWAQTMTFLQSGTVEMWLVLGVVFLITKLLHEMGHAFTCRKFGGEVHEIGIMFLVLMPCPYVDASTAWSFPSKWKRVLVATGGMIAELFIAAIAVFVWAATGEGTVPNQVAYYTILIASVSTILFNANPLLRFDGYYILSDLLEIPNLQNKSREYTLGLVKRYVFRVKTHQPLPPTLRQKFWMVTYNLTSGTYRIFIGFAILMMVLYQLPEAAKIVGLFLAAGAIATFFVVPMFKLFKYLTTEPELHRKRTRAWAFTLGVAGCLWLILGVMPVPSAVRAQGVGEPLERAYAVVKTPGFVEEILIADGQEVEADQPLVRLRNEDVVYQLFAAEKQLEQAEYLLLSAQVRDAAEERIAREQLEMAQRRVERHRQEVEELVIRAPHAGRVLAPQLDQLDGAYLNRGQAIALVGNDEKLEIFIVVDQGDYERILADPNRQVQIRLAGNIREQLHAEAIEAVRYGVQASPHLRSAALTYAGGGTHAPAGDDPESAAGDQFHLRVTVSNPRLRDPGPTGYDRLSMPGQRAYVRVKLSDEPIARQGWRGLLQLIQTQRTPQAEQMAQR